MVNLLVLNTNNVSFGLQVEPDCLQGTDLKYINVNIMYLLIKLSAKKKFCMYMYKIM